MNEFINDINNIVDSGQLILFTVTEDSVEDLI
jgi:archaellum biogenesis ATPase FlaH